MVYNAFMGLHRIRKSLHVRPMTSHPVTVFQVSFEHLSLLVTWRVAWPLTKRVCDWLVVRVECCLAIDQKSLWLVGWLCVCETGVAWPWTKEVSDWLWVECFMAIDQWLFQFQSERPEDTSSCADMLSLSPSSVRLRPSLSARSSTPSGSECQRKLRRRGRVSEREKIII